MHKLTSAPPLKRGDRHLCSRHPLLLLLPQGSTCFLKQGGGLNVFGLQRLHLAQCLRNPRHSLWGFTRVYNIYSQKRPNTIGRSFFWKKKHYKMKQVFSFSQNKHTHPKTPNLTSQPTHHPKTNPTIQPSQPSSPTTLIPRGRFPPPVHEAPWARPVLLPPRSDAAGPPPPQPPWLRSISQPPGPWPPAVGVLNRFTKSMFLFYVYVDLWLFLCNHSLCLFRVITPMLFLASIDLYDDKIEDSQSDGGFSKVS